MRVQFYRHELGEAEFSAVRDVLESVFLTTADRNEELEAALARYLGVLDTVSLSSCTAALHLALLGLGIGPGDEVITTPMSFVASSNAILLAGATPVFVDVDPGTGLIDLDKIPHAMSERTKALLPVHLYGAMVDMQAIQTMAKGSDLAVIEDAAHAVDASRFGVRPGQLSDAACMSFYATKAITSGEGGALATEHETLAKLLRRLRNHGMTKGAAERYTKRYQHWDVEELGWKYNMTNFQAAMLLPQLERIDDTRARRARIARVYASAFRQAGVAFPTFGDDPEGHSHHLFTIWVEPAIRDRALASLEERGVGVAVNFRPIHLTTFYQRKFGFSAGTFPVAERIGASTISLPLYPSLTDEQIEYVIASVLATLTDLG